MNDMRIQPLLAEIRDTCLQICGDKLIGIYVHGSLAFGCFRWDVSDVDFLVVVGAPLTLTEKQALATFLLCPQNAVPDKGLEMSVVLETDCRHFRYPTPFLFHYSESHRDRYQKDIIAYCETLQGTDSDLAAHFTVTREVGYPLVGPAPKELFAPVPPDAYKASLLYDVGNMEADIAENPVYGVLNLCRVLAWCREGVVLSKAQGGLWGMKKLSLWQNLIARALGAYETNMVPAWDEAELRMFARSCLVEIL